MSLNLDADSMPLQTHFTPRSVTVSALFCVLFASMAPAGACQVLSEEEAQRSRLAGIEKARAATTALQVQAGQVFVGTMSTLTFEDTEHAGPAGIERLRVYQAGFDDVENVKGVYAPQAPLEYAQNIGRVTVGCGIAKFTDPRPSAYGIGKRYPVYALEGKLLRVNPVAEGYEALTAEEEADLVRSLQE